MAGVWLGYGSTSRGLVSGPNSGCVGVSRALLEEVCLLGGGSERRTFEFPLPSFDALVQEEVLRGRLCVAG